MMRNTQRLDKLLSNLGYGTRKEIKQLIKKGTVKVDGETARDSGMHVDPLESIVEIDGEKINYRKYIYIMLNKPQGVVSATYDNKYKTVVELLPDEFKAFKPFPAGRLDIDTEGFLLMTNDGQLAHELLSPKKHVPKKYYALIEGEVTSDNVEKFKEGIILDDGYKTMPAQLEIIRAGSHSEIELVIHEGKFHQVKRMFIAVGKKVKYLRRIEFGGLRLDEGLKPGECRELTDDELKKIKER